MSSVSVDEFLGRLAAAGVVPQTEVDALLAELSEAERPADGEALAQWLVEAGRLTAFQAETLLANRAPGLRVDGYLLTELVGRGGMGDVYRAVHRRMGRTVAVKMLSHRVTAEPTAIERFHREVEAAGRLTHSNVVHAYDAGQVGEDHYLVLEYVDGPNLSDWLRDRGPLPVDQAVDFVMQAARGLAYAHGQGVVHRDVKPANLLVSQNGQVKILDLGIAYVVGTDGLTRTGEVVGTVETMAPEQIDEAGRIDGRTDVYGLGCTLYLLLTGRSMFPRTSAIHVLRAHVKDPIPSVADTRPDVPAELDAVYRKMVAKRPKDRYATMDQVVDALAAVPSVGDAPPVLADPETTPSRSHRRALLAVGITLVLLAAGVAWWASGARGTGEPTASQGIRGARFHVTITGPQDVVHGLAFTPDGTLLAAASGDGGIDVYDAAVGERRRRMEGHEGPTRSVVFLPDGKRLASASNDRTVRIWDLRTGDETAVLDGHERRVREVVSDPDGRWLASTGRDGSLRLWDADTGAPLGVENGHPPTGHAENTGVLSLAVHPTGTWLATAGFDRSVCLWQREPLDVLRRMGPHETDVGYVAFSPDGRLLAYDLDLGKVRLVEVPSCETLRTLPGHNGWVLCLAFSPDSSALATGGEDRLVKLWSTRDGSLLQTLEGHQDIVTALAFSADGTRLASGSADETIRLWEVLR